MRSFILFLLASILLIPNEGCRKPDYVYRSPCQDSTLLKLSERSSDLTASERIAFDSLRQECAKYEATEEGRGKLWPYLMGGAALLIALIAVILWLNVEPVVY